jgi:phospholipid transport system substrate-binding protein
VLKILSDAELKKEAKVAERRRAIRTVAADDLRFRRDLAAHRSPPTGRRARRPSVRNSSCSSVDLLENAYISKIEGYTGEKIVYSGRNLDSGLAVVKTRIVTKQGTEIPSTTGCFQQGERWRAYDVNIEGISLVSNYRAQFNTIIARSGYPDSRDEAEGQAGRAPGARGAEASTRPRPPPAASRL